MDPWGVGSANLGRPIFAPICGKTLVLKGFGENLRQKWGAPNLQIQRPTDPTPPLKPSDRRHPVRISVGTGVLRRVLRRGAVIEGA